MTSLPSHVPKSAPASWPGMPASVGEAERDYDEKRTMRAWELFVSGGKLDSVETQVRAAIRHSWLRSANRGVDAYGRGSPEVVPEDRLAKLREANAELMNSAQVAFQRILDVLGEAGSMAVVTDPKGTILDVAGNPKIIDHAHDIKLEVGAVWGEAVAGTNGIGTALATGRPTQVHAGEHFCKGVKSWTCVGAPIFDPIDGRILGLIDFSGPQALFHPHSVALAMMSASQIEHALAERMMTERMQAIEASLDRLHGTAVNDGIIILDRFGRIVHFNAAARRHWPLCDGAPTLALNTVVAHLDGTADRVVDLASRLPKGLQAHGVEPLMADGRLKGAMLILNSRRRPASAAIGGTPPSATVDIARARIIGRSEALQHAIEAVMRTARSRTSILLEGETGVGKELFAQLAHATGSITGHEPFIALNCGAISKDLLGGELFGHAPGAFTGATREGRAGRFEHAHGGTLSLDEIGEMPLDLQPYLLRALEDRAICRLGESKPRPVDVRLVASTNRKLRQEVEEGRFRRDLYYRISVVQIAIPPLRDRAGDVLILLDHYNEEFAKKYNRALLRFEPAVLDFLDRYDWPGNVRELRNLVERLSLMTLGDVVQFADLPADMTEPPQREPRSAAQASLRLNRPTLTRLEDAERSTIEHAVAEAGGNVSAAADRLGVARSTIYRKLHHYRGQVVP